MKLVHYSTKPGLTTVDPKFHGTGVSGAESKRKIEPNWVDRSYSYREGTKPEAAFEQMPHVYESEVPDEKIYDMHIDPLNLKSKSKWGNALDLNLYEKNIKNAGFHGFKNSGLDETMGNAIGLFNPIAVKKRENMKKNTDWKDQIKGGLADEKKPSDFNLASVKTGQKVEREHTSNKHIAEEIAMDHLTEDPQYYKKLKQMEKTDSKQRSPHDYAREIDMKIEAIKQKHATPKEKSNDQQIKEAKLKYSDSLKKDGSMLGTAANSIRDAFGISNAPAPAPAVPSSPTPSGPSLNAGGAASMRSAFLGKNTPAPATPATPAKPLPSLKLPNPKIKKEKEKPVIYSTTKVAPLKMSENSKESPLPKKVKMPPTDLKETHVTLNKDNMPHPPGSPEDKAHDIVEEGEPLPLAVHEMSTPQKIRRMFAHLRSRKDNPNWERSEANREVGHDNWKSKEPMAKKYEGFKAVEAKAAASGARNPAAVAAAAGFKKYGKKKMEEAAHSGHKLGKAEDHIYEGERGGIHTYKVGKHHIEINKMVDPKGHWMAQHRETRQDIGHGHSKESALADAKKTLQSHGVLKKSKWPVPGLVPPSGKKSYTKQEVKQPQHELNKHIPGVSDKKYDSCVSQVKAKGTGNPYAICTASLKKMRAMYKNKLEKAKWPVPGLVPPSGKKSYSLDKAKVDEGKPLEDKVRARQARNDRTVKETKTPTGQRSRTQRSFERRKSELEVGDQPISPESPNKNYMKSPAERRPGEKIVGKPKRMKEEDTGVNLHSGTYAEYGHPITSHAPVEAKGDTKIYATGGPSSIPHFGPRGTHERIMGALKRMKGMRE